MFWRLVACRRRAVRTNEECAAERQNKLRKDEYDKTTWSARTWLTFKTQKVSVALHRAVALELANALGLSAAVDAP